MSLILDALRKSEAARRRSETPDLFSPTPQAHAPVQARPAWPLWTLAGFGIVSSAIAVWMLLHRPAPEAPAARETDAVVAETPAEAAGPASMPPAPAPVPTMLPVIPTAPPPASTPSPITASAPPTSPASSPAPLPATTTAPSSAPSPSPAAPKPLPAPPTNDRPTALGDLDAEVRRQLPPLKLSMHFWNDDPQRRFVILDGQRVREGDTLGELVIERIDRDDVVLSWRGARLRLPAE